MLAKRITTAVIGIAAAVLIVSYGQWPFAAAVLILALLAWHEFTNMMVRQEISIANFIGMFGILLVWATAWLGNSSEMVGVVLFVAFLILAKMVLAYAKFTVKDAMFTLGGILYIGLTFPHLVLLRFLDTSLSIATPFATMPAGAAYLWLAFIGTWASDTFAFFVGSSLGRHKLAPAVSPAKTWEGTIGGVIGSVLCIAGFGAMCKFPVLHSCILGLLVGCIAPLGDLVESALKRYAGVKDSGRLLPGHGGVLDRFDSIMFSAPVVYYYVFTFFLR